MASGMASALVDTDSGKSDYGSKKKECEPFCISGAYASGLFVNWLSGGKLDGVDSFSDHTGLLFPCFFYQGFDMPPKMEKETEKASL